MNDPGRIQQLRRALDDLCRTCDYPARLASDPLSLVHRYEADDDREIAGLLVSAMAYGRVSQFMAKTCTVLERMDAFGGPAQYVKGYDPDREANFFDPFRHRVTPGTTLGRLCWALQRILQTWGSLGRAFVAGFDRAHDDIGPALTHFVSLIYQEVAAPDRAFRHLIPSPVHGSACKRLNLYLRWMVRTQPGMDLGCWTAVPTSHLIIPVDTHILRLSGALRLTLRTDPSWRTAQEITRSLRLLDPMDPVRFDFALCHLGMSGGCEGRYLPSTCSPCGLKGCVAGGPKRHLRVDFPPCLLCDRYTGK